MQFISYDIHAPKNEVFASLYENDKIVEQEKFETSRGVPNIHIREKKNNKIKITCEFTGRATKDNGFLEGTYFIGRLSEADGVTKIKGIVLTAPIYHSIIAILFIYFVFQCIVLGGFSPIPIIALVFSFVMFRDEFKKQNIIKRYIFRAFKNTFSKMNTHK